MFCRAGKMGKKGNWFSAVKKAFRSPSKDKDNDKSEPKDPDLLGDMPPVAAVSVLNLNLNSFRKLIMHTFGISLNMNKVNFFFWLQFQVRSWWYGLDDVTMKGVVSDKNSKVLEKVAVLTKVLMFYTSLRNNASKG